MSKQQSTRKEINLKHICSDLKSLPRDFFRHSIFGRSMTHQQEETVLTTPSDLNIQTFKLKGFPSKFCAVLENGLPLLLGANPPRRLVPNHASANLAENKEFIANTLEKWRNMGILEYTAERPHIVNPLSVVTNGTKKRLVLDARSSGLNDHIIAPKFRLPNAETIIQSLHSGDFMAKLDLANGFLQLPICKKEQTYLGFRSPVDGKFGTFKRLSFGLRSAPFLFSTFTNAIKQATKELLNITTEVYIDDWFISSASLNTLTEKVQSFIFLLSELGVTIQHEKTEGPAQSITYLGMIIDTTQHVLRLPESKRHKYLVGIEELLNSKTLTMSQVAKTAGRLVHIASIHREGAAYIQPFWDILYKERKQWTRQQLEREGLTIDPELHNCLQWWKGSLSVENVERRIWVSPSRRLFIWSKNAVEEMASNAQTICTDASSAGWGASTKTHTATGIWSNRQMRTSSNWKELKAVNLAIGTWDFIQNSPVLILSDSATVIAAIRKRASQALPLQTLLKELTALEASRNIETVAIHIPGKLNDLPDRLSRGHPVDTASLLQFEKSSETEEIEDIQRCYGLKWSNMELATYPFSRCTNIETKPQTILVAVSTPDLPFLKRQLQLSQFHSHRILLLIPKIATSELPLPFTKTIKVTSSLKCIDALNIEWTLLEVVRNGGIDVKTAISD